MYLRALLFLSLAGALVLLGAQSASSPRREYVQPRHASSDGPPFSAAVRVGDTLYLSGDVGLDDSGKVPVEVEDEARLLLERFQRTLGRAGMTMDDLVSVQVFCSDVAHYDVWNRVYRSHFRKEFPARAFVGSGKLLFDARFEMLGIAVKR